eukprot:1215617-Amphidinium_carterae.1
MTAALCTQVGRAPRHPSSPRHHLPHPLLVSPGAAVEPLCCSTHDKTKEKRNLTPSFMTWQHLTTGHRASSSTSSSDTCKSVTDRQQSHAHQSWG